VLEAALRAARGLPDRLSATLDARSLQGTVTGTQVHVLELIRALARARALRLRLLLWRERLDPATLALLRELADVEILFVEDVTPDTPRTTIFHRPQQTFSAGDVDLALALGDRLVLSQLDLIAYRNPGYFDGAREWLDYRRASRHGLVAAERVVVFSEHTRAELDSDALLDPARVRVVPPGLDHDSPVRQQPPAGIDRLAGEEFLLCLGTDFRHKNRVFALRLVEELSRRHGYGGALVLAGTHLDHGASGADEAAYVRAHEHLAERVVDLGAVSEEEKGWLLAHAQAVLYPSAYEGFGLVPFESALAGAPCVFAPQSSLAEVAPAGAAAIVPWDVAASAARVHELLIDPAARERNVQELARAARALTWADCAGRMIAVYREAAGAPLREGATLARDASERERVLAADHAATVQKLIDERELVLGDYEALLEEVGPGRALVGPHGGLPPDLQQGLLALTARPALARAVLVLPARLYAALRALARGVRGARGT
jgi:glycosyltransferase involved in cell wall biosynthesis